MKYRFKIWGDGLKKAGLTLSRKQQKREGRGEISVKGGGGEGVE